MDSRYDPHRHKGGIFQVSAKAARHAWGNVVSHYSDAQLDVKLQYNYEYNIATAALYIKTLYEETNDWQKTYSMYNRGNVGKFRINNYARFITK